ncbi:MAG: NAD-dependent succinate-semialdehyde dehydrogenase [Opitutaceae bacterium]
MALTSINPATGMTIAVYEETTDHDLEEALGKSQSAFREWRQRSFPERADCLRRVAGLLHEDLAAHARLITTEMGKPILQARAEVEKCSSVLDYYATHGEAFLADEVPVGAGGGRAIVAYQPIGLVLAVMPWNYPFWQVFRAAAPALMAGNVMVLKHASNVTGCALEIERIFSAAGFPDGVFQTLRIGSSRVGPLIRDPRIRGVTLTGSTEVGRRIGEVAGRALKTCVLELGGSDPYLILKDADLDRAVALTVQGRLNNNGQSCIAVKRLIVEAPILPEFRKRYIEATEGVRMGDPLDESFSLGPLARQDLRDELHAQVITSRKQGARLLLGGTVPTGPGWYYPATVLGDVRPGMVAYEEELFGPVASIIEAGDAEDGVRIANDSRFGLGGGIFSEDRDKAVALARRIETGAVFINDFVKSHPALPFGGVKDSGFGRELGRPGIRAFTNMQTISVS